MSPASELPSPSATEPISTSGLSAARVILKPRKALPFFGRHPWVLASAVDWVEAIHTNHPAEAKQETDAEESSLDGQIVDLYTEKRKFIARGFYNSQSRIRVRLFTWSETEALDEAFWRGRIAAAIAMRRQIGYEPSPGETNGDERTARSTTACRLIFSEADGLSGLIVDRYGDYLVLQATSLAVAQRLEMIARILMDLVQPRGIVLRTEKSMALLEGAELVEGQVWGELAAGPIVMEEHGIKLEVDFHEGQKTGYYLDQRDNRRAAAAYFRGRRVLDLFCYTGGFSLTAATWGGAKETLGVDCSKRAIAQAQANATLNGLAQCRFEVGDGFQTLDALQEQAAQFDAIILDPPKFARNRGSVNQALMAYHRINRSAVKLLSPGGILVTCSCSGNVSREDFLQTLSGVAQKTGRDIQILEVRGASPDHPVSSTCLETEYLKCVICRVV